MTSLTNEEIVIAGLAIFFAIAIGWMVAKGYRNSSDGPGKKPGST